MQRGSPRGHQVPVAARTDATPLFPVAPTNSSSSSFSLAPARPAPAVPVNIFAGPSASTGRPAGSMTANASMRTFSTSLGNPSARPHPVHRDASNESGGAGIMSPLGIKTEQREWTYFGVDFVVSNLAQLSFDSGGALVSPSSESGTPTGSSSSGNAGSRRPQSVAGSLEVFSSTFGDGRWRVELYKSGSASQGKRNLSLSIICLLIDTTLSTITVPATVTYGVREPRQAASKRLASSKWLYQRWSNSLVFSAAKDSLDDMLFPSLDELLENDCIRQHDSFVLSIQIQSPLPTVQPLFEGSRLVPQALLQGIRGLLDDRSTGDVTIVTYECRQPNREAASQVSNDEDACLFRKRTLYAHGAILKARSSYFKDMLSDAWAETTTTTTNDAPNSRSAVIKIDDFDFTTVYWFLHYLYTDDITFEPVEDVRKHSIEALPQGWSSVSDQLTFDDFYAHEVTSLLESAGHAAGSRHAARSVSGDSVSIAGTEDGSSSVLSGTSSLSRSQPHLSPTSTMSRRSNQQTTSTLNNWGPLNARTKTGRPSSSSSPSSTARPPSSLASLVGANSARHVGAQSSQVSSAVPASSRDPHSHPCSTPAPASALAMYKIAHRYSIPQLADLALEHLVLNLTPRTAFPLLLSTPLWPDLHKAIKSYALQHFQLVSAEQEMARCYAEVAAGEWPNGGEVLLDFTLSAVSSAVRGDAAAK